MMGDTAWVTGVAHDAWGDRVDGPHVHRGMERPGPPVDWRLTTTRITLVAPSHLFHDPTGEYMHGLESHEAGGRLTGMGVGETWLVAESGVAADSVRVRVRGHTVALESVTVEGEKACGLTSEGQLYCWGAMEARYSEGRMSQVPIWGPVPLAGGLRFAQVTMGTDYYCGLTSAGEVYCRGSGSMGQLGHGGRHSTMEPVLVTGGLQFREIATGYDHTCGITLTGELHCWGSHTFGSLGTGDSGARDCVLEPCSLVPVRTGLNSLSLTLLRPHGPRAR